jgi:hypothetical protein
LFFDKDWTVVVYSARQDNGIDLGEKNVVKRCASAEEGRNMFGCISSVEVIYDKQRARHFHLMFRSKTAAARNLILPNNPPDQPFSDVATFLENAQSFPRFATVVNGKSFSFGWCWGDPLNPNAAEGGWSKEPLAVKFIELLSGDEGYIAFRHGSGIDRAVAINEKISHSFFNLLRMSVEAILVDGAVPNCGVPYFQSGDGKIIEFLSGLDLVF